MINVSPEGRLGNNLFQYAFSRIIHENTGLALEYEIRSSFFNAKSLEGIRIENSNRYLVTDFFDDGIDKLLQLDDVIESSKNRNVHVRGFFQHRSYYENRRKKIQDWIGRIPTINRDACCVHIRRGDYLAVGWSLPNEYYEKCIEMANPDSLHVFSDDFNDTYVQSLIKRGATIVDAPPDQSIYLMGTCGKQIISRSTFSWWSSFLSEPERVFYPMPQSGWWSIKDTPLKDIRVDSPEYTYVEV